MKPSPTAQLPQSRGQVAFTQPGVKKERSVSRCECSPSFLGLALSLSLLVQTPSRGQTAESAPKQGAALLKTDIMGVFAHPDDETGIGPTLAFYALGRRAVVADVYCTRGEGGGNMVGRQSGAALGALREAELRDCLSTLGVRYCYFLDRLDWAYTESLAATLEKWGREETLGRLVRLVRLLRPEVIITMNPAPTPGQHGHHQAAAVLATEAFSAAADPKRFPDQLTKEGLSVWQTRRLLYAGGGNGQDLVTISVDQPLATGQTPAQVAGRALRNHRSQAFGSGGNPAWLSRPQKFTLVKAFVAADGSATDLMAGLPTARAILSPEHFAPPRKAADLQLNFVPRPAVAHYRQWIKEQGIEHVAVRFDSDLPVVAGEANTVKLRLSNESVSTVEGNLRLRAPAGWAVQPERRHVHLPAGAHTESDVQIRPPPDAKADVELAAVFDGTPTATESKTKLHPLPRTTAPRLRQAPAMDGTDRGWDEVPVHEIAPTDLVEGTVHDAADSSALFRLAHDDTTLFVDVQVKDDVVVTNIAPDDIKGHWRSDSVEICVDPAAGSEHTMGCYKLGIFPFDTTGRVRGARDADANQGPIEETAPRTRLFSRRTADGYRIQAAIPFDEIKVPAGCRRLGFNLIIYDGDKSKAALGENINKSRIAWAPRPGVQGRPEDWGRIDLQ